jgi:hypothetical protein
MPWQIDTVSFKFELSVFVKCDLGHSHVLADIDMDWPALITIMIAPVGIVGN